jgi:hypothetical protein
MPYMPLTRTEAETLAAEINALSPRTAKIVPRGEARSAVVASAPTLGGTESWDSDYAPVDVRTAAQIVAHVTRAAKKSSARTRSAIRRERAS